MRGRGETHRNDSRGGAFVALGLDNRLLVRALVRRGYVKPTPIQRKVIPLILAGRDVVAMARTGSGKTAAFLAPLIQRLALRPRKRVGVRGLVISPTRELALQTFKFLADYSKYTATRAALLIGGESLEAQFAALAQDPEVVIATPGRLLQILEQVPNFTLSAVEIVVLDEADRLWEGNLGSESRRILEALQSSHQGEKTTSSSFLAGTCQKVLMSATLPHELAEFSRAALSLPAFVRLDKENMLSPSVETGYILCRQEEKISALISILRMRSEATKHTLIFVATRHHAEYLHRFLDMHANIPSMSIHGHMDQTARNQTLERFRKNTDSILIVTDVAARGLDIPQLDIVINFHFPPTPKLFVHRCGRVGRGGRRGWCWSLVSTDEIAHMLDACLFVSNEQDNTAADFFRRDCLSSKRSEPIELSFPKNFGRLPSSESSRDTERMRKALSEDMELELLSRSAARAYKLYRKTRAKASRSSLARARCIRNEHWTQIAVHPLFRVAKPGNDVHPSEQTSDLTETGILQTTEAAPHHIFSELHRWRPQTPICTNRHECLGDGAAKETTVLAGSRKQYRRLGSEKPQSAATHGNILNGTVLDPSSDGLPSIKSTSAPLDRQRELSSLVEAPARKRSYQETLERERRFAIPSEAPGSTAADRIRESFLQLEPMLGIDIGETNTSGKSSKALVTVVSQRVSRMQWDSRRKKFVQVKQGIGDINNPRVRRQLHRTVGKREHKSSKSDGMSAYERWIQKTRAYIQRPGELRRSSVSALALQTVRKPDYRNKNLRWTKSNGMKAPLGLRIGTDALPTSIDVVANRSVTRSVADIRKQRKQKAIKHHIQRSARGHTNRENIRR
ncbi:hypothetical protein CCYA_CCYA04G1237 [Cyanidiococcus yangmingshanensis]|nr:hypothetical protein CCYA_CCYA04G1237 [Cyanidiococcus yangmingshanensis]